MRVYLDNNATTPLDPKVLEAMMPYLTDKYGNAASRNHAFGWEAEEAVDQSRNQIANLIGAKPKELIFTSGATEANNLALKGLLKSNGNHIVTCVTEHKAMLDTTRFLENDGIEVTYLGVNANGEIDLQELDRSIKKDTSLISLMMANNETGIIHPIKEISSLAKKRNVLLMTDATQAVGKIEIDVEDLGIDLMSFSAHKMYGPKGVGALYVKSGLKLAAQIEGGGHERGMRSGTLNVPGIVGFGKACELCREQMRTDHKRLKTLRDRLEMELLTIDGTQVNGGDNRLSHVSNVSFANVNGEQLLLSLKDIAVSHGSACTSASFEPSHVLKGMGLTDEQAFSTLRFGLGRFTTDEEIDYTINQAKNAIKQLRN